MTKKVVRAFESLSNTFGPQNWWPVTPPRKTKPEYTGGPVTPKQKWEVVVGAILTQNTSWSNVEKALESLNREKLTTPDALARNPLFKIKKAIRPAGYFNQKAAYLKTTAQYLLRNYDGNLETMFSQPTGALRHELLALRGVGQETADSILLYSAGKAKFVVDAYTRRIVNRLGWLDEPTYDQTQAFFEENLPHDTQLFQEYHALFVELAKKNCFKKAPECKGCPLEKQCRKKGV